jgi:hypothetical protein
MAKKTLIDLKSNLRELNVAQFGGKQLVKHELPEYNQDGPSTNFISARVDDLQRISKLLTTTPAGTKFATNNALLAKYKTGQELQKSINEGKTLAGGLLRSVVKDVKQTAGAFASAIAQTPVNGTGTHFIWGIEPDTYLKNGGPGKTALGKFLGDIGIGDSLVGGGKALTGQEIAASYENVESVLASKKSKFSIDGEGEEGSLLGKVDNITKTGQNLISAPVESLSKLVVNNKVVDDLKQNALGRFGKKGETPANPAAAETKVERSKKISEGIQKVGRVSEPVHKAKGDTSGKPYTQSPISLKMKHKFDWSLGSDAVNQLDITTKFQEDNLALDTIPFQFVVMEPLCPHYIYLRALLDNLDDSYTGEWGSSKYVGRAEKFYRYNGFDRQITLGFKIAAFSKEELFPIYQKLNILVGATAPTYGKKGQFMRGTMTEITVGDYLVRQKGFMSNISLTWQSDYPWEINSDNLMVPHVLDVSITFTPIHDFNVTANLDASKGRAYMGSKREVYQRKKVEQVNSMPDQERKAPEEVVEKPAAEEVTKEEVAVTEKDQASSHTTQWLFDSQWMDGKTTPKSHIPSAGLVQGDDSTWKNVYPNGF